MLAARHKLSRKLCANLVEAVVEAHSRPNQEASFRNALLRGLALARGREGEARAPIRRIGALP